MPRIRISREELATTLSVWLTVAGIKHPWMLRNLWRRNGDRNDDDELAEARRALAEHLACKFEESKHEVTRNQPENEPLFGHKEA